MTEVGRIGLADDAGGAPASDAAVDPAAVYRKHWLGLVRMAVLLTGDRETAQDIVQDAFVAVSGRWERWQDEAAAVSYLRTSVLNGVRSRARRRALARRTPVDPPAVPAPGAEVAVVGKLRQEEVAALVRSLPTRQREVLVLRYFAELSVQETARQLGISQSAVKSSASRALQALAERADIREWL